MSDWPAIGFSDALARSTRCGYRSRRSSCKRAEAARNAVLAIIAVQVRVYVQRFCFKAQHWCQAAHRETFGGR